MQISHAAQVEIVRHLFSIRRSKTPQSLADLQHLAPGEDPNAIMMYLKNRIRTGDLLKVNDSYQWNPEREEEPRFVARGEVGSRDQTLSEDLYRQVEKNVRGRTLKSLAKDFERRACYSTIQRKCNALVAAGNFKVSTKGRLHVYHAARKLDNASPSTPPPRAALPPARLNGEPASPLSLIEVPLYLISSKKFIYITADDLPHLQAQISELLGSHAGRKE